MENEKNYIDKLYSDKFSKYESNISDDEWAKLSIKLSKVNFLKFSFTTFNAYFLLAIVTFVAAVIYFGINNFNISKKNEKLNDKIETFQDQQIKNDIEPLIIDTFDIEETKLNTQSKITDIKPVTFEPTKKTTVEKEPSKKQSEKNPINTKTDTSSVLKPDTQSIPKKKIIRVKKKVFIKQDKVIIKDTVTVKKKE
jgi:hypothetical protein